MEFGAARPSGASLALAPGRHEVVDPSRWPDACEYLTDAEIRAIVPSAEAITRTPTPEEVVDVAGDGTQRTTASAGSCEYDLDLPPSRIGSDIHIGTVAVAHPKLIKRHHREAKDAAEQRAANGEPPVDHGDRIGADACYSEPSTSDIATFTCRSGPLMFEVWGQTPGSFDDGRDEGERQWEDRVLPEVIKTVAARTRTS